MTDTDVTGRGATAGPSTSEPDGLITSVRNERVRAAAALQRRRERRATGRYLVEGPNAVGEVLAEGHVETLFCRAPRVDHWRREAAGGDPPVEVVGVADHVLERLSDARTPQDVVAVAHVRAATLDEVMAGRLVVVLVAPADPGNLGTIIRTADAAGADGIVVTAGGVDPWNPKVVRATTGSLVHVPLVVDVTVADTLAAARAHDLLTVALDMDGDASVHDLETRAGPVALVFGTEAHGLDAAVTDAVDRVVAVPTPGRAESLNLSAAVAVTLFAAARGLTGGTG